MPVCPRGHASDTDDFCDECGVPMGGGAGSSSSSSGPSVATGSGATGVSAGPSVVEPDAEPCPWCGTPRTGRFCEEDGYDFVLAPAGPGPSEAAPPEAGPSASGPATSALPAVDPPVAASSAAAPAAGAPGTGEAPGHGLPDAGDPSTTGWSVRVEADRRYFDATVARRGPDIGLVTFPTYYPRAEVPLVGDEMRIGRRRASSTSRGPEIDLSGPPLDPGVSRLHAVLLVGPSGWSVLDPGSTNGTTINYADEPIPTDTPVPVSPGDRIHVGAYTTLVVVRA